MARRRSSSPNRGPLLIGLAVTALLLFAGGEAWRWGSSDSGRWFLLRTLRMGNRAQATRLVGDRVRRGLTQVHVSRDSIHESVLSNGRARVRWRVGLVRDASPTQANFAVARALEAEGGEVMSAREAVAADGGERVTMVVGVHGAATHEIVLARPGRPAAHDGPGAPDAAGRIAIVLYGLDEDEAELVAATFARREPLGVAVPVGRRESDDWIHAAESGGHERVLQLPMEPENYPRVTPGPGALLVSMPPGRIGSLARRYLEDDPGAVAVSNLMGSFALQDEPLMTSLYKELRRPGLTFVEITPGPRSVAKPLASSMGVAYDQPDVILDAEARASDDQGLDRAWSEALEQASARGHQLVWLRVTTRSLHWLDRALAAKRMGAVTLVPPSRVLKRPGAV